MHNSEESAARYNCCLDFFFFLPFVAKYFSLGVLPVLLLFVWALSSSIRGKCQNMWVERRYFSFFSLYENMNAVVLNTLWVVDLFPGQLQSYGKMHATALSFPLPLKYVTRHKFCYPWWPNSSKSHIVLSDCFVPILTLKVGYTVITGIQKWTFLTFLSGLDSLLFN